MINPVMIVNDDKGLFQNKAGFGRLCILRQSLFVKQLLF